MVVALPLSLEATAPGMLAPTSSLAAYITWAYRIPSLSLQEEKSCFKALIESNCLESAKKIVLAHLKFVVQIARTFSGYGLPEADLIQEGNVGLLKAIKRFDPAVGVRLVTFALHWIKSEIYEYVISNWKIVKMCTTKEQRKLFFNLHKATNATQATTLTVAQHLNVSEHSVQQMSARMRSADCSTDAIAEDGSSNRDMVFLGDPSWDPARLLMTDRMSQWRLQKLQEGLNQLDDRSQTIVRARWLSESKETLEVLAAQLNLSLERVRQIEKAALLKLKRFFSGLQADFS